MKPLDMALDFKNRRGRPLREALANLRCCRVPERSFLEFLESLDGFDGYDVENGILRAVAEVVRCVKYNERPKDEREPYEKLRYGRRTNGAYADLQDAFLRYARAKNLDKTCVPGCDGFAFAIADWAEEK